MTLTSRYIGTIIIMIPLIKTTLVYFSTYRSQDLLVVYFIVIFFRISRKFVVVTIVVIFENSIIGKELLLKLSFTRYSNLLGVL